MDAAQPSAPFLRGWLQASQLQLWVVRTHNGALTPYNLRAQRPPAVVVPGEDVENKIAT